MFKDIDTALSNLEERRNMVLGIDHLYEVLAGLNNPQNNLKMIHIGGTNGKGSTTNFVRSILEKAGFKVGTFTSPHLISHHDRIRLNDIPISDEDLLKYINKTYPLWEKHSLSMFEIDMIISLLYFNDKKVDYVIYEVGLGGRLDATNVIKPLVSAITNVHFDHTNILGDTLELIAKEKAGIIKGHTPLLTTSTNQEVITVLKKECAKKSAPLKIVEEVKYTKNKKSFTLHKEEDITLVNQGLYQKDNANLAINIIKELDLNMPFSIIKKGIENTHWQGRFEEVVENVYVDGAHNERGVQMLIESLDMLERPITLVFSALSDKDHHSMLLELQKHVDKIIVTEFDFYRKEKADVLARGINATIIKDYQEAIDVGIKEKGTLLISGSLYFVSVVRKYLLEAYR
ncbi:MAG TPA: folylpolyglutamate synthase/dihydrofolate synthase family protein [Erysipelothrix sp.]|nr:folylpolyglutamate synthase/dihydrofolate synthase family protein [Erysipelothrix sp.]